MKKNILIINSSHQKIPAFANVLEELSARGHKLSLISTASHLKDFFSYKGWRSTRMFLPKLGGGKIKSFFFAAAYPGLLLYYLSHFYRFVKKNSVDTLICLHLFEKLIFTPLAKMLKLKVIWIEWPETDYKKLPPLYKFLEKRISRDIDLIIFSQLTAHKLSLLGFKDARVTLVKPFIKQSQLLRQDTIFDKIARDESGQFHKKYFTLGTILNLDKKQNLEILFHAVKTSLAVVPNLQLIVIGEGEEKKNLSWLAKKMQIDNLVWFIGEQAHTAKWLTSFDIFIATTENPDLEDMSAILSAMSCGLPVIGPRDMGLEDFITEDRTGALVEMNNSETLARQIIKLHQNGTLRAQIGKNGKELVDNAHTLDKIVGKFEEMIISQASA